MIRTLGAPVALASTVVQGQDSSLPGHLQGAALAAAVVVVMVAMGALCAACGGGGADEDVLVKTQPQEEPPC